MGPFLSLRWSVLLPAAILLLSGLLAGQADLARGDADIAVHEGAGTAAASNVQLPAHGSVFLLDNIDGNPQLMLMHESDTQLDRHTGTNLAKSAVMLRKKQTIELEGYRADVRVHTRTPKVLVRANDADGTEPQYAIVKLKTFDDHRELGELKLSRLVGKPKRNEETVAVERRRLADRLEFTPKTALADGEYAVVKLVPGSSYPTWVYDFGVDGAPGQ